MFKILKLQARILTGYSIPLVLSVISAGIVYIQAENVSQQLSKETVGQKIVKHSDLLAFSIASMHRAGRGYLIDQNPDNVQHFTEAIEDFENAAKNLQNLVEIPEQKNRLNKSLELARQSINLNKQMLALAQSGKIKEAIKVYSSNKRQEVTKQLEILLEEFNKNEEEIQIRKRQQTEETLRSLIILVVVSTISAIILAMVLGWWIASRMTLTIHQSVNSIATSSTEIATAIEEQERIIDQQAAAVNQTTTTMDELGVSSRQSAIQAESARAKIEVVSNQIFNLIDQVKQIDHIANAVSDLANQTNMLALNAAVEAVRAGEHGRGFGVVATEIRKLADQSKKSAEKINNLVAQIQQSTNSAIVISDTGNRNIESVIAAINDIGVNTQQISLSAQQQATAIQEVVQAMNQLNRGAQETVSGINQTKIGIQNLNQVAIRLKEEV